MEACVPERPPSLRSLAAFEAAARHQSFVKAATELNLTPGAVSHAIRALEDRIGDPLFERQGRGVNLTRTGRAFAARVRLGLTLISDAFGAHRGERVKRLVVSTLPSIASKILLPALDTLHSLAPGMALDLRMNEDLDRFGDSDVDVAVRFGPGQWAGLAAQHIAAETLVPVCSPALQSTLGLQQPADLLACPLIDHPSSSWKLWFDAVHVDFRSMVPWLTLDDAGAVIDAAAHGHGVALARVRLARNDLISGRVVRLFAQDVKAEYEYYCVSRPSGPKTALTRIFGDWLAAEFAGSPAET